MTSKHLNTNKLRATLKKQRISQEVLAQKCGISRQTIQNMLKGDEIGLHKFLQIVDALGLSVGYLFDETPEPQVNSCNNITLNQKNSLGSSQKVTTNSCDSEVGILRELIKEKDERIADLKERIIELKALAGHVGTRVANT